MTAPQLPDTPVPGFGTATHPAPAVPPQQLFARVDGVFQGGGALGTAYVGALRALADANIWFARVAGNSAGAITAALIAAGFTAREIEALSSAYRGPGSCPASLQSLGVPDPVRFTDFLDPADLGSISRASKRRTLLWQVLNGTALDILGKQQAVPKFLLRDQAVEECKVALLANRILSPLLGPVEGDVEHALQEALIFLPEEAPLVEDLLPDTRKWRNDFADLAWDAVANAFPFMVVGTNLAIEGGIYEGRTFLDIVGRLLSLKVFGVEDKVVKFADLPIPLTVIASNIRTRRLEIYDYQRKAPPQPSVVEAVRRSMSVPFVFQPRGEGRAVVDGGVISNFPVWLFTESADVHWPAGTVDHERLKIGFLLNDASRPPDEALTATRFRVRNGLVDARSVLRPRLRDLMRQVGAPDVIADAEIDRLLPPPPDPPDRDKPPPSMDLIGEVVGVLTTGMAVDPIMQDVLTSGLMSGLPYAEISIPLLGFHWLDFEVNEDGPLVNAMWHRAWYAAHTVLVGLEAAGKLPPGSFAPDRPSPYPH